MNLDPDRFSCPIHDVDLTDLVREKVREDEDADIAFGASGPGPRLWRSDVSASPRQFEVLVPCSGGPSPHMHVCRGTYAP